MEQSGQVGFYQRVNFGPGGSSPTPVSNVPPTQNTTAFLSQHPSILYCTLEGQSPSEIIAVNPSGYKWVDRVTRDWAQYDFDGQLVEWGKGAFRIGQVLRSPNGLVRGYADTYDNQVVTIIRDNQDRIKRIRDYGNRQIEYDYNSAGLIESFTDSAGIETNYSYNNGQIAQMRVGSLSGAGAGSEASHQAIETLSYSNKILTRSLSQDQTDVVYSYEYDKVKGLYIKTETASGNRVTRWTWDIENNLISLQKNGEYEMRMDKVCEDSVIIDRSNRLTYVDRDSIGFVKAVYHPDGRKTRYQTAGREWPELDQEWGSSGSTASWGVTQILMASGATVNYGRNSKGLATSATYSKGSESKQFRFLYDSYGNLIEKRLLEGSAPNNAVDRVDTWQYDSHGNIEFYEDSENRRWLYELNSRGDVTKVTEPSGNFWRYFYNGNGQLERSLDPIGYERLYNYSNRGLLIEMRDRFELGQEAVTRYAHNHRGLVTRITDPLNHIWHYEYNDSGEVETATDPEQKVTRYTYDFRGRVKSVRDGNNVVVSYDYFDTAGGGLPPQSSQPFQGFERVTYPTMVTEQYHDLAGRVVRTVRRPNQGAEQVLVYDWDDDDQLQSLRRADASVVTFTWDVLGRPLSRTEPGVGTFGWSYPSGVRVVRHTDPTGGAVERRYNPAGDLLSEVRADQTQVSYSYDPNGRLRHFNNSRGNVRTYSYNDAGSLNREEIFATATSTTPVKTITYSRNLRGDYLGYSDGATSQNRTVDKFGRVVTNARNYGPFTTTQSFTYTPNGNPATHTAVNGVQHTYMWDAANNFQGVIIPGEGSISLGYNQQNWINPVSITFPGGASQSIGYDGLMRLEHLTSRDQALNTIMDYGYSYQAGPLTDGLVDTVTTEHGVYDYGYDSAHRLTSVASPVGNESYTYDGLSRRQPASGAPWTYNANGAPLNANGVVYTYDSDGNRSTRSDGVTTSYIYDESNQLVRVERPTGNVIARYGYDPMGERLWKENGAGQRTYFEYDDDGIQAELDATGSIVKSYIFAPGSEWGTNPLAMKQGSTYHYYHNDHQGRPVKLTNNVGAVTWSGRYSAYGIGTISSQGASNPIRAPGQYADPETGLYNNFQRNYDPEVGTYLEEDPFGVWGGPNRYNYGDVSPLRLYDPMGLWTAEDVKNWLMWTGLTASVAGLSLATVAGAPVLIPIVTVGVVADLGILGISSHQCYQHFRDPCNQQFSGWDCVDIPLSALGAAGGATALKGLAREVRLGEELKDGYRAVSEAEAKDILDNGFRPRPDGRSMDDKWFSETLEGAEKFRKLVKDSDRVISAKVPKEVYDRSLKVPNIDGTGPGFCVNCEDLGRLKVVK
jgi:RHS repeat-associated protein